MKANAAGYTPRQSIRFHPPPTSRHRRRVNSDPILSLSLPPLLPLSSRRGDAVLPMASASASAGGGGGGGERRWSTAASTRRRAGRHRGGVAPPAPLPGAPPAQLADALLRRLAARRLLFPSSSSNRPIPPPPPRHLQGRNGWINLRLVSRVDEFLIRVCAGFSSTRWRRSI